MGRLGMGDLPWPEEKYRVDLQDPEFESFAAAWEEDKLRAKLLRKSAAKHGGGWGVRARELADRIDPELSDDAPVTQASSRYMRDQRIRFTGAVWKLYDQYQGLAVRSDIVRRDWRLDLAGQQDERPRRLLNEFSSLLNRAQAGACEAGFLIAVYHNDFIPNSLEFQQHLHLLIADDFIPVVESFKVGRKGYESHRRTGSPGHVIDPVQVRDMTIANPGHCLSYLLKGFWLAHHEKPNAAGQYRRNGRPQRIPEPYHSEVLLWLDQWRVADLILLRRAHVTSEGLALR